METTFNDNGRLNRPDPTKVKNEMGDTPRQWRSSTGQEISDLMTDVQDLVGRVANVADPEVARLRAKVTDAMSAAKSSLARGSDTVRQSAKDAMNAGDTYVREQPWQAIGVAAAAGLVVGFLIARR
jgi:ElaB/YqjD/DUF883 family membrane-anchored ribosome-binding protein